MVQDFEGNELRSESSESSDYDEASSSSSDSETEAFPVTKSHERAQFLQWKAGAGTSLKRAHSSGSAAMGNMLMTLCVL